MEQKDLDVLLSLAEAVAYLRVCELWLVDRARNRGIASMNLARTWVSPASALRDYVMCHASTPLTWASSVSEDGVAHVELAPPRPEDPYELSRPR